MVKNDAWDKIPIPDEFPSTTRCLQVQIPDGDEYVNMLFRALGWLANWTTYEREASKQGKNVADLWKAAIAASLPEEGCSMLTDVRQKDGQPCILEKNLSGEWQPFANLRYCPPNLRIQGGVLQYYDEGTSSWVDYPDDTGGAPPGGQPGGQPGGTSPVPYGECHEIVLTVLGNSVTAVPFRVSPGDTVLLTSIIGGWTYNLSATAFTWMCGTGKIYAFGQCGATDGDDTGAIITGTPLGKLICQYGEHFFDAQTLFTIPDTWDEATLFLRMNDPDISDNAGSVTAKVEVCSGQWCYTFDFSSGALGWAGFGSLPAYYEGGVWHEHFITGWHAMQLRYDVSSEYSFKRIEIYNSFTAGSENDSSGTADWQNSLYLRLDSGSYQSGAMWPTNPGSPCVFEGDFTFTDKLDIGMIASQDTGGGNMGGSVSISRITFYGIGSNPFGTSNCT